MFVSIWVVVAILAQAQSPPPLESSAPVNAEQISTELAALGESGQRKLESGDVTGAIEDFQQATELAEQLSKAQPEEPSHTQTMFQYLERLAAAYAAANRYEDAIGIQKPVADGSAEFARGDLFPEADSNAAHHYERLAWYQMLNGDAAAALRSVQQGAEFEAESLPLKVKQAHALLLTGDVDGAKAIYNAERSAVLPDGRTFQQVALADFAQMEKAGITDPRIAEIRQMYGAKQPGSVGFGAMIVAVVLVFAVIAGIIALLMVRARRRTEAMTQFATSRGYTFRRDPAAQDRQLLSGTSLGARGDRPEVQNVLEIGGTAGQLTRVFDYTYETGDESRTSYNQTVAEVESTALQVPEFWLRPEGFMAKAAKLVGVKDINFPEYPEFSKRYLLTASDEAAVRRVFTPAVVQFCEQHPKLEVEAKGDRLVIYRSYKRLKLEQLPGFIDEVQTLTRLLEEASRAEG